MIDLEEYRNLYTGIEEDTSYTGIELVYMTPSAELTLIRPKEFGQIWIQTVLNFNFLGWELLGLL